MPIMQELIKLRDSGKLDEAQSLWFRDKKPMEELFDLENDPEEMVNVIDDDNYKSVKSELYTKLLALQEEVGDTLKVSIR